MKSTPWKPRRHLFVCVNRRDVGDPLGEGCGARGEAVYAELKRQVSARGAATTTWVTRTLCLGLCPKRGTTVACPPGALWVEVEPDDAPALVAGEGPCTQ